MPPRWLSRISGTSDEIGETAFTNTVLQQQHALLMPCRALPIPKLLPQHLRAAASPKSWVEADRVPRAPSCYPHLEQMAAPSLPQPSLAPVAPGSCMTVASLTQPLPAPMEINSGPGSVMSTLTVF